MRATIAREWRNRGQSVDWELLERMEQHQKAVEAAVAKHSSRGEGAEWHTFITLLSQVSHCVTATVH